MIIGFEENLVKIKEQVPIITLILKKGSSFKPKCFYNKIDNENNTVYYLNLESDFFDNLSIDGVSILDNIIKDLNLLITNGLNQKGVWKSYIEQSSIIINTATETKNIDNLLSFMNKDCYSLKDRVKTIEKAKDSSYNFELYYDEENNNVYKYPTTFRYSRCNDEKGLIYNFLELLFTSKNTYSVLNCANNCCNRYFVSNKSDTLYCSRLTQSIPCYKIKELTKKKYENISIIEKVYRTTKSSLISKKDDSINDYTQKYKDLKDKNVAEKEMLLFLKEWLSPKSKYYSIIEQLLKND